MTCTFFGVHALEDVSLELADSEFIGLRGPNAAGKTTLLNAIGGLVAARGRIWLHGTEITNTSSVNRSRLGVVRSFENNGICENMSPVHNVAIGLARGSARRRMERATAWLTAVGGATSGLTGELSYGQKRRIDLARVLARVEELGGRCVVLLDEPFRGLDSEGRTHLASILREHFCGRVSTIMVEHNAELTEQLASRIVWMENGRIIEGGDSSTVPTAIASRAPAVRSKEPALSLVEVRAGYGRDEVLHGIDLEVGVGENVRVIGKNGSGKSTLLRVIMGSLPVMSGTVRIFNRKLIHAVSRSRVGIGYAPQGGRLVNQLTVEDHLKEARRVAKNGRRRNDLGQAFLHAFPEITELLTKRAGDLSSGQRSLVSMASAMATEPSCLIADEPAAGLATKFVERLSQFLRDVWVSPTRTTVIVEHEQLDFPSRPICLERGELIK